MDAKAEVFDRDAADRGGYVYTTNQRLSSQIANRNQTDAICSLYDFRDKTVLDVGCGDGTYTRELFDREQPAALHGIDPASSAIDVARAQNGARPISYSADSAYHLPFGDQHFDAAHIRGVLHHLDDPRAALKEALRVARVVVVLEPNGYNPVLKVIEKASPYHRAHQERSYAPRRLDAWVGELGGMIEARRYIGLVPFFCPDAPARLLKRVEPFAERLPLLNRVVCGNYAFRARRSDVIR